MPADTRGPFPRQAVRDLLGITRSLYRAQLAAERLDGDRLDRLAKIGNQLREALDLAVKCRPGTMGRRAAWEHAERATTQLGQFVQQSELLRAAVAATEARLMRR